ncbi:RNA polymerase sigma factor [Nannocystis pusilla]|uniref:RNA polymerase sigma factor n=1 Tax=Nannocystis pusilla TaxID=889268 RepID=UPI003DA22DF1
MAADDGALLTAWRSGDRGAGKQLFERYYDSIARFFRGKIDHGSDDFVQEVFAACVAGSDRLRAAASFRSYLFAIAHNVLRDHFRRRARVAETVDIGEEATLQDLSPGVSTLRAEAEDQRLLLEALRRIPLNYQVIIELRFWESMTTAEIAEVLRTPHPTARSRLRRALELLEAALDRLGEAPARLASTRENLERWAQQLRDQRDAID